MDLWVVAAAAGAGYLAKYWQNLLRESEGTSESLSGSSIQGTPESRPCQKQFPDRNCLFSRLARRKSGKASDREEVSDGNLPEKAGLGGVSATAMISASGLDSEALANLGKCEDYNQFSISSFPSEVSRIKDLQETCDAINEENTSGHISCDPLPEASMDDAGSLYRTIQIGSSLRSKRPWIYSVKPLSSLESCLVAQMFREQAEMEEYVLNSLPSPSKLTVRPLFVTDGNRIISRASSDFNSRIDHRGNRLNHEDGFHSVNYDALLGTQWLPEIGCVEPLRSTKRNKAKRQLGGLSSSGTRAFGRSFSQGPPDRTLIFVLGVSIGVISTIAVKEREMDKLKKEKDNLIQDLQEELELTNSLTVKELPDEGYESQEANENSFPNRESNIDDGYEYKKADERHFHDGASNASSPGKEVNELTTYDDEKQVDQNAQNSTSMSNIEAELEDELERLGLNVKTSSLESRLPNLDELDPDFVSDIVHGELRADMSNGQKGGQAEGNRDASGSSSPQAHTAIYPVSPRELSLRLHEVIQSRLENRIMELETELQHSQKKMHFMELEHMNFQRDSSNSETGSQESPHSIQERNGMAQPLVLNLRGEALDAYNEVYEEFTRITEREKEMPPSPLFNGNQVSKESAHCGQCIGTNGLISRGNITEERQAGKLVHGKVKTWEDWISRSQSSSEGGESDDEEEITKQLIKQIVEKTRQGSPVVLNAQRMLFSMDEKQASE